MVCKDGKVNSTASSLFFLSFFIFIHLFLLIITKSGLLAGIRWSICISKCEFFTPVLTGVFFFFFFFFHWYLNDSSFPKISRTLPSILPDLYSTIVWMILDILLIYISLNFFSRSLGTFLRVSTSIDITITFTFLNLFSFLKRSEYLSVFSLSLIFSLWSARTAKFTRCSVFSFLLINSSSGLRWFYGSHF